MTPKQVYEMPAIEETAELWMFEFEDYDPSVNIPQFVFNDDLQQDRIVTKTHFVRHGTYDDTTILSCWFEGIPVFAATKSTGILRAYITNESKYKEMVTYIVNDLAIAGEYEGACNEDKEIDELRTI